MLEWLADLYNVFVYFILFLFFHVNNKEKVDTNKF